VGVVRFVRIPVIRAIIPRIERTDPVRVTLHA
jgi:hypothetical protein